MLEVGNKLKCKKSYNSRITSNVIFKEGNSYPITKIDRNFSRLEICQENGDYQTVMQFDDFDMYNSTSDFTYHNLWEYFYTLEELRKIKIESILNK